MYGVGKIGIKKGASYKERRYKTETKKDYGKWGNMYHKHKHKHKDRKGQWIKEKQRDSKQYGRLQVETRNKQTLIRRS